MVLQEKEIEIDGRIEAKFKVTGSGKYSAEYEVDNLCYGILIGSTVPAGKMLRIHTENAKKVDGVLDIISYFNKPIIPAFSTPEKIKKSYYPFPIFHTDEIYYKGQHVALVLAKTLEDAQYAASLVEIEYEKTSFKVNFFEEQKNIPLKSPDKERGNTDNWKNASHIIESNYTIQAEVHHPMEPHATIAEWLGESKVKLYDKNQGVNSVQRVLSNLFELKPENVEVISEFVGGGFGSGLLVWSHTVAAVLAAKHLKQPVKIVLSRQQMFYSVGFRPASWQRITLGADNEGIFLGLIHQHKNECSLIQNFSEGMGRISRICYAFPNLKIESAEVPLHISMPTWMRGPGECSGAFALECAIDDLCYKLNIDPVQIRLKNISYEKHPDTNLPWSTHFVKECIEIGAEKIEWNKRQMQPAQTLKDNWYEGYGMAVGMWGAGRTTASASVSIDKKGIMTIKSAMTDIGTGTGTGMLHVASSVTGMPKTNIRIQLGNSNLPPAPSQGGSIGFSSIVGAVEAASKAFVSKLILYASSLNPQFKDIKPEEVTLAENGIVLKTNSRMVSFQEILEQQKLELIEETATASTGEERKKLAFCVAAAHYCKLKVHKLTGKLVIEKYIVVVDGGKIINQNAAANQVTGAVIGGIGMALMEQTRVDTYTGSVIGDDFAGYHFPVNSDTPIIDVHFIDKPDYNSNPAGSKGIGEVGIIGSAAAIANAIYSATGIRLKDLPITPEKMIVGV